MAVSDVIFTLDVTNIIGLCNSCSHVRAPKEAQDVMPHQYG